MSNGLKNHLWHAAISMLTAFILHLFNPTDMMVLWYLAFISCEVGAIYMKMVDAE